MSKPEILEKIPMNLVEVKKELRAIKKRDGELSFRGNKTEEYVNLFAQISQKDANDLRKKLDELQVPRLKAIHSQKIVDLLPRSINELKVLLQGYAITVSNENLKKIADLTAECAAKKKKAHEKGEDEEGEEAEETDAAEVKAPKPKKKAKEEPEETAAGAPEAEAAGAAETGQ